MPARIDVLTIGKKKKKKRKYFSIFNPAMSDTYFKCCMMHKIVLLNNYCTSSSIYLERQLFLPQCLFNSNWG
jgi:hypothetical protein